MEFIIKGRLLSTIQRESKIKNASEVHGMAYNNCKTEHYLYKTILNRDRGKKKFTFLFD